MIALGAIQAGSQIYSGYKQKEAADQNAGLMREQGEFQRSSAYDQASSLAKQGQGFIGSQKAGFASAGVKTTSGSPLAALRESEKNLQKDVSRTRQAGDIAYQRALSGAGALEQQGKDAFTASLIGGATSFAGTLANNVNMPKKTTSPDPFGSDKPYTSGTPNTNSWMANSAGLGGYNGSYTGMFDQARKPQQSSYMNQGMTGNMINSGLGSGNNYGYGDYNYKKYLPKEWGK